MEASTLQTPKTGRSRYSKALPAPPPFTAPTSSLPTLEFKPFEPLELQLSSAASFSLPSLTVSDRTEKQLPPIQAGPPLPPPKQLVKEATMTAVRPLESPLPPLPRKPVGLPPVVIPRRPVAAPPSALSATPALAPAPVSPASPSPVGSISSFLSAYSNHTSESTPRSSTNSNSDSIDAKGSYSIGPPGRETKDSGVSLSALSDQNAQKQDSFGQRTPATYGQGLPPPPPLKDVQRGPPGPQTQTDQLPTATHTTSSPLANSSPSQEQLWRRRSVRSEKNLAVRDLKLVSSHGSTAASGPTTSQGAPVSPNPQSLPTRLQDQPEAAAPAARTRVPVPRSTNASLPGRNIRPVASRQQIVPQDGNMGQKTSNLTVSGPEIIKGEFSNKQDASRAPRPTPTMSPMKSMPNIAAPPSVVRLPTPEYEFNDVKSPVIQSVVSPVSPASSPDLPTGSVLAAQHRPTGDAEGQIRQVKSSPALALKANNPGFSMRPPMGLPASPAVNRKPNQMPFPSRTTSRIGDEQPRPSPAAGRREPAGPVTLSVPKQREQQQFRPVPDGGRTISENGSTASDETVKPKALDLGNLANSNAGTTLPAPVAEDDESELTDHPGAALFPRNWYIPLPVDQVMEARPLQDKHFRCLTSHRYMTASRQRVNPIACRTCGHKDRVAECFICSACHINICAGCNGNLRRFRGNLDKLLRHIDGKEAESSVDNTRNAHGTQNIPRPDSETFVIEAH
ncbi:hypothetical protein B0H67DRAFT_555138 [Lasiosphaeris hirsuta]|uniref:Uncharacterized protein n=1 Tax=Lasiosphaeris hirsuta TaxID=260670 RepID=A0AA40A882_9PEZI|nr:hypothetical protein B0H67DRAFT_555138 [Lasiosphaeris hirsuta]